MKFADWQNYIDMHVEHFSTLHPNKGQLIWMAGANVTDPCVSETFWRIWKSIGYEFPVQTALDRSKCYIFEMLNPERTNIVEHEKADIILTGVRDLETLKEEEPEATAKVRFRTENRSPSAISGRKLISNVLIRFNIV
jgi:hypothetical protein